MIQATYCNFWWSSMADYSLVSEVGQTENSDRAHTFASVVESCRKIGIAICLGSKVLEWLKE